MATFTISLSGSAVVNGSKSWTVSDADVQGLVTFLIATYSVPGGPTLTPQQALLAWTQSFVSGTIAQVQRYQRTQAAIAPITFT